MMMIMNINLLIHAVRIYQFYCVTLITATRRSPLQMEGIFARSTVEEANSNVGLLSN